MPSGKDRSRQRLLFFGAANYVAEVIEEIDEESPRHLLIVGHGINFIDVSGAMVIVQEAQRRRKLKRELYLCRINREVYHFLDHGNFLTDIGKDHIFSTEYDAISRIFATLDYDVCRMCTARIFKECGSIPESKDDLPPDGDR
jgi:SulP family sulfate permease